MANIKTLGLGYVFAGLLAPFMLVELYIEDSNFIDTDIYIFLRFGLFIVTFVILFFFFWGFRGKNPIKNINKTVRPFPKLDPSRTKIKTQLFFVLLVLSLIEIYLVFLLFEKPSFILPFIVAFYLFVIGFGYLLGIFVLGKRNN